MSYSFDAFNGCLNQPFTLLLEDARLDLELIEVDRLNGDTTNNREAFSIVLRSNSAEAVEQGTYRIENTELGEMNLFIVPIGPDNTGMRYEAVFS